jgi:hypothetical protein
MKLLRMFAWSWGLSAIAIFSVASAFTRSFDPNCGDAFIASILGVMPAGLLTLIGFMIKAIDESIEARVASALICRGASETNRKLCPLLKSRRMGRRLPLGRRDEPQDPSARASEQVAIPAESLGFSWSIRH